MSNRFDNQIFRCSQSGKVISKSGKLTQGVKSYLEELFVEIIYSVRKDITSKYFEKGVWDEEDGIDLLKDTIHRGMLITKNRNRFQNDFVSGEADCVVKDYIYDIKNAWDQFTFEKSELTWEYEWQLRAYMWLWNKPKARLFYCINEMPDPLIEDEARRYWYREKLNIHNPDGLDVKEDIEPLIAEKYSVAHLSPEERFKVWEIHHEDEKIEQLKDAISDARKYLNQLDDERNERILNNKRMMGVKVERKKLASKLQKIEA